MSSREEMLGAIGDAIQTYAILEFKLFQLVERLLDVELDTAAAVFYTLRNSRDRNSIVKSLLKVEFGDEYSRFWNSLTKLMGQLDESRNQIVHGLLIVDEEAGNQNYILSRPESYWVEEWPTGTSIDHDNITTFIEKARTVGELIQHFVFFVSGMAGNAQLRARWEGVFAAAVIYPLPEDHPLNDL